MARDCILSIDQGTTSTRAIVFDRALRQLAVARRALGQRYPANGWVEHDPEDIWRGVRTVCARVLREVGVERIKAIGLTNQRETSVLWDRETGRALHPALVWQDRRTHARCAALKREGREAAIARRTGLLLDPYFSATKMEWLLRHVKDAQTGARDGRYCLGTIDAFLLHRLTGGAVFATDITNASRTMLMDLRRGAWDADLLGLFSIPRAALPEIRASAGDFGMTDARLFGRAIPVRAMAGDQQAAMFGQACLNPGDIKATYGTGCFALLHTGASAPVSKHRLLSTALANTDGERAFAIEGSIFMAGAVVQWLRDRLGVIRTAAQSEVLSMRAAAAPGLYCVPAFTGLGAPYWDAGARGAFVGLTRDAGAPEMVRAALDSVCYQTRDLIEAMAGDAKRAGLRRMPRVLKIDGGMAANNWFCQRLSDLTGLAVARPRLLETTALGAAALASMGAGSMRGADEVARRWQLDARFEPRMRGREREALYAGWRDAVAIVRTQP